MSYQNAYITNTKIRLINELTSASYLPNMKDYIVNLIIQIFSYQYKSPTQNARYSISNFFGQDKIAMVLLPINVPFNNRTYDIPIQIYLMKNIPYEPPQIFIEVGQGSGINLKNTDIDVNSKRILVNGLRKWNQYSVLDSILNEIRESFKKNFPIYKKSSNNNMNVNNNNMNNMNNINNNNNNNINNNNFYNVLNTGINNIQIAQGMYHAGAPTSIYGQPMVNNNINNNVYYNNNVNNGIPNQMNLNNNVNIGNNNNNLNSNNSEIQIKNIMINEIISKVINLIKYEKNKFNQQKIKLNNFKNKFIQEKEKINNYLNQYTEIENSMKNDLNNINNEINNTNIYLSNNSNSNKEITKENCLNFININDNNKVLNLIAKEAFYEEMNKFIKKVCEKQIIDFMSLMHFQRNLARNQFTNKYLLDKFTK